MKRTVNILVIIFLFTISLAVVGCQKKTESQATTKDSGETTTLDSSTTEKGSSTIKDSTTDQGTTTEVEKVYTIEAEQTSINLEEGQTEQIEAKVMLNGEIVNETIAYSSLNDSVATVTSSGLVEAKEVGSTYIVLEAKGAELRILVNVSEVFLLLDYDEAKLTVGGTHQISAYVTSGEMPTLTYESEDPQVATVSDTGLVTAVKSGTTSILVKGTEKDLEATLIVVVTDSYEIIFPELEKTEYFVGDEIELNAVLKKNGVDDPSGLEVEENPAYTIDETKITLTKSGKVTVSVVNKATNEKVSHELVSYKGITTIEEFYTIGESTEGYFKLLNDLDFSNEVCLNTLFAYSAGYVNGDSAFQGIIDGQGHSLLNYKTGYNNSTNEGNSSVIGWLGYNGVIKNMNFINVEINGRISGAIATANYGLIENCYVEATIKYNNDLNTTDMNNPMGGVCSKNYGKIKDTVVVLHFSNNVVEKSCTGAIAGRNYASGVVENCFAIAEVGLFESTTPTTSPTQADGGKTENSMLVQTVEQLNNEIAKFENKDMWTLSEFYPHLGSLSEDLFELSVTESEHTIYPDRTYEIVDIVSKYSYSVSLKEAVEGVSLTGNTVAVSGSVEPSTEFTVVFKSNYVNKSVEVKFTVIEVPVNVVTPEKYEFTLFDKESKEEDFLQDLGITLTKDGNPFTGEYEIKSQNDNIAKVEDSKLRAVNNGETAVEVYVEGKLLTTVPVSVDLTYVITTKEEFLAIGTDKETLSRKYVLGADLDFEGAEIVAFSSWNSNNSAGIAFTGEFNGRGHTISNFVSVHNTKYVATDRDRSIFGYVAKGAVIENLNIIGAKSSDRASIVANWLVGTVRNIYCEMTVTKNSGANVNNNNPSSTMIAKLVGGTIENCVVVATVEEEALVEYQGNIRLGAVVGSTEGGTMTNVYVVLNNKTTKELPAIGILKKEATQTNVKLLSTLEELYAEEGIDLFDSEYWCFDKVNKTLPHVKGFVDEVTIEKAEENVYAGIGGKLTAQSKYGLTFFIKEAVEGVTVNADGTVEVLNTVAENTKFTVVVRSIYDAALSKEIEITVQVLTVNTTSVDSLSFDFIKGESEESEYTKAHNVQVTFENGTPYTGNYEVVSTNEDVAKVVGDNIVAVGDGTASINILVEGAVVRSFDVTSTMYLPIKTAEEFKALVSNNELMAKKYKLMNDIDFGGERVNTIAHYSAGYTGAAKGFNGIFDGQGYSLMNMVPSYNGATSGNCSVFGTIASTGVVRNTNFIGILLDNRISGAVSTMNYGLIENCFVDATFTWKATTDQNNPMGGVCSKNYGTLKDCLTIVTITADSSVNIGAIYGRQLDKATTTNCHSIATVAVGESATPTNSGNKVDAGTTTDSSVVSTYAELSAFVSSFNLKDMWVVKENSIPHLKGLTITVPSSIEVGQLFIGMGGTAKVTANTPFVFTLASEVEGVSVTKDGVVSIVDTVAANTEFTLVATSLYDSTIKVEKACVAENLEVNVSSVDSLSFDFIKDYSEESEYTKAHNVEVTLENGDPYTGTVTIESSNEDVAKVVGDNVVAVGDGTATISVKVGGATLKEFTVTSVMYNKVSTKEEFLAIATDATTMSKKYKLVADIDFEGAQIKTFSSYASNSKGLSFKGVFDGNNHFLKNFDVVAPTNYASSDLALFGYMSAGSAIRNLNVTGAIIHDRGAVLANWVEGTIENCFVEFTYTNTTVNTVANQNNPFGGIAAKIENNGLVQNNVVIAHYAADLSTQEKYFGGACVSKLDKTTAHVKNTLVVKTYAGINNVGSLANGVTLEANTTNLNSFTTLSSAMESDLTYLTGFTFTTETVEEDAYNVIKHNGVEVYRVK